MKKLLFVFFVIAFEAQAAKIPARSVSVETNGFSVSSSNTVQGVLDSFDNQFVEMGTAITNLSYASPGLLPKTNGLADTLSVTNSITLNGQTITEWQNPTNGISLENADLRYFKLSNVAESLGYDAGKVPSSSAVTAALEAYSTVQSVSELNQSVIDSEERISNIELSAISPSQPILHTIQVVNGTGTVSTTYNLVSLVATSATVITFANNFPISGVNRVGIEVYAGTNAITFDTNTVANTVLTFSTNGWTSTFFRQVQGGLWSGRQ